MEHEPLSCWYSPIGISAEGARDIYQYWLCLALLYPHLKKNGVWVSTSLEEAESTNIFARIQGKGRENLDPIITLP